MKKILFICTGNTCRSSMAEAIARKMIEEQEELELKKLEVASAGLFAFQGDKANEHAITVAREEGADLEEHLAQLVSLELLQAADFIFAMTQAHKDQILSLYPEIEDKIYLLKEYAQDLEADVIDPFGQSLDAYRETYQELAALIAEILPKIQDL